MSSSSASDPDSELSARSPTSRAMSGRFGSNIRMSTKSPWLGRVFLRLDLLRLRKEGGLTFSAVEEVRMMGWVTAGGGVGEGVTLGLKGARPGDRGKASSES
jgi:hypothetical protein